MISFKIIDLGLAKYLDVLQLQEQLFNKNIEAKTNSASTTDSIILCEHEPVFTLGKSGKRENILVSDEEMNAEFYNVNRGGDVTFHGPGQLVVYPILDLDLLHIGLAQYIFLLEETIIESLKEFGLTGERIENAAGIWIRSSTFSKSGTSERKIGAIGVKASRNITMHGIAINVNTDLTYFDKIVPCGLAGKKTTSLQKELGEEISMDEYKKIFITAFEKVFSTPARSKEY
ncbi:MAG: lipoyl(octanoyl) transferase LipB [Bacteroidetes bacterium]|nr:lipoyl(octanoyl) transferase LipB [Bacteroidota bacterium]